MGNSQSKRKKIEEEELKKLEEKEKLTSIASVFLAGKDMEKVSDAQKRIFLKRKGLTDEMIDQAYKRFHASKEKQEQERKKQQQQKENLIPKLPPPASLQPTKPAIPEAKSDK